MTALFPEAPELKPINNDKWIVEQHFTCIHKKMVVNIKKGFETDGASIPRLAWRIIGHPFSMPLLPCALIHDALYAGELLPRNECDWMFLELMKKAKIGWIKRNAVWSAVRLGGGFVWSRHTVNGVLEARKHCNLQLVRANAACNSRQI